MAQRDINTLATVTDVVAQQPNSFGEMTGKLGSALIERDQEAKIGENLSKAHAEVAALSDQYKIDFEGDPLKGMEQFQNARQQVFDKYSDNISPFFRRAWDEQTTSLAKVNDAQQTAWAYEQTHKNTIQSVNDTMQNYLAMASKDGEGFGKGKSNQLEAFANFGLAQKSLEDFGNTHLGEMTTKKMMEDFKDDYIKTYVSGVTETNPARALKLLDDPTVRDSMKDPDKYYKFKEAVESRAKAVQHNMEQGGVLASIKKDNAPLGNGGALTYAQLQQGNFSDAAKEYYSALNGFSGSGKRGGFTEEDKAGYKMAVFDNVQKLVNDPRMDAGTVRVVQDSIYKAMTVGAMTQAEGTDMVKQITEPLVAKKEDSMSKFSDDHWFSDDIGFGGIQDFYDKNVKRDTEGLNKDLTRVADTANVTNKAKLYDYYMGALTARAGRAGVPLGQITDLPSADRKKIYGDAQKEAQRLYLEDHHPSLRTLPDTPNFVYTNDGRLVQGMTGDRNLKPAATAKGNFKFQKDTATNDIFRVFPDGTKELYKKGNK